MLALSSCITDIDTIDERQVEITLVAGAGQTGTADDSSTRASNAGDPKDRYINSLRVMGFRIDDGTLAFNNLVFYNASGKVEGFKGKILVNTGRYDLVLIANEHADSSTTGSIHEKLDALQPGVTTLNDLADLSFPSSKTFDSSKNIPMIARVDGVKISTTGAGDPAPGTTNLNNSGEPLRIMMKRLGIRLDLDVKMYAEQIEAWWNSSDDIYINGIPDRVYLFPRDNTVSSNRSSWILSVVSKPDTAGKEGLISVVYPRIILPEVLFSPVTDKTRSMSVSLDVGGKTLRGMIAIDRGTSEDGYTVPRNSYLNVTATAKPDYLDITAETVIEGWDNEELPQDL
jgi:hypothetical protein